MKEMVGGCCVCSDERGWPDNPLVYCDGNGCTVAVHQACYGIVTVPTGPWFCRKCESPDTGKGKVRCELCPSRSGALKRTDTGGWAHVVCALYIPEVRFGNVTSMEPIVLGLIPPERFTRTCYICTENGKAHRAGQGACMACNKTGVSAGCKQQFHVTCAQSLGLLCEEAGNYLDNVKYCGYCQHHYSKLFTNHEVTVVAKKKGGNVKTIPPYKPVSHDSHSSGSSSEKEGGASPVASGSGTPTPHTSNTSNTSKTSKGPGRKSSQTKDSKSSHSSKASPATTSQTMDKKKSPSRRQSSTGDGAGSSKSSTPAPSPSHAGEPAHSSKASGSGGSSERGRESSAPRSTPPAASPGATKSPQTTGVISSVAAASTAAVPTTSSAPTTSAPATKPTVSFQESVITNTDAVETKHTKKRKAAAAATAAAAEQAAQATANEAPAQSSRSRSSGQSLTLKSPRPTDPQEEKLPKKRKAAVVASAIIEKVISATETKSPKEPPGPVSAASEPDTRYTKKRKAAAAAASAAAAAAAAEAREKAALIIAGTSEPPSGPSAPHWDHPHSDAPVPMDTTEKVLKKAKTDSNTPPPAHYMSPPPPPQHSQPPMRSPRNLTSPMPGPSAMNPPASVASMNPPPPMNPPSSIRSPSQHQGARAERERSASLRVSVPLPPPGAGRHFHATHQGSSEMPAPPSPHVFHQPQKPATFESGMPSHSPHGHSQRTTWGTINIPYEIQQDPNKPGVSGVSGSSKDHSGIPMPPLPMPQMTPAMRNKKRAAMATTSAPSLPPPQSTIQMASTSTQSLASVRRHQQMPAQPQMYPEPVKDSPPMSPNTERQLKAKVDQQYFSRMISTAPHMLGNELNPDSGAAARLQEQLNAELAAHAVGGTGPDPIVPPPLINKAAPGSSSGRSTGAQSLDQLLERQWEQGSQFLMEQAQHFDIASLLSCLHQLRTENVRLEEHVANLLQRRDHLLAVNARLAIPLNAGGVADSNYQMAFPGTGPPVESGRCSREGGPPRQPPPARGDADRERHERHAERAQQVSHQMLMREVQQKPS